MASVLLGGRVVGSGRRFSNEVPYKADQGPASVEIRNFVRDGKRTGHESHRNVVRERQTGFRDMGIVSAGPGDPSDFVVSFLILSIPLDAAQWIKGRCGADWPHSYPSHVVPAPSRPFLGWRLVAGWWAGGKVQGLSAEVAGGQRSV
jgi:hypothetical protein